MTASWLFASTQSDAPTGGKSPEYPTVDQVDRYPLNDRRLVFDKQLVTTHLFADPAEAAAFADSPALSQTMDLVRKFSFDHGLLGQGAPSADVVGIQFPDGTVLGDKGNVKLRFDDQFMKLAAAHKL